MKHFISTLIASLAVLCMQAQTQASAGKIVLHPYLEESSEYGQAASDLLADKLAQIVTQSDMSCSGADERFILTAHMQPVGQETTATLPAKTLTKLNLTLYIGNGQDGTLFASHHIELKGVGADSEQAIVQALHKLQPGSQDIASFVEQGRRRIVDYYEQAAPSIITAAKAAAKGKRYAEAMSMLQAIPSVCSYYEQAQQLIGRYGLADYNTEHSPVVIYHIHWW